MNPSELKKYLDSFANFEVQLHKKELSDFSLEKIKDLLKLISDPQDELKIIHVAGSKGKGSVCAMTANILRCGGYKVGLYTSPHLEDVRERIRIFGGGDVNACKENDIFEGMINELELCNIAEEIKWALDKIKGLTYFEVLTAIALFHFRRQKVDFAVLETGLGGRLDATNVASSLVCAITSISLEHVNVLGDTIEKIASEKAAIIKSQGQRVVLSPQDEKVMNMLMARCQGLRIDPIIIGRDIKFRPAAFNEKEQTFSLYLDDKEKGALVGFERLKMPLLGRHQIINAAVSFGIIFSLSELGFDISDEAVYKGFKEIYFPGRFEVINKGPLMILDGAHNEASAKCLVDTFCKLYGNVKCKLLFGMSKDKNLTKVSKELNSIVNEVILTRSHHPRSREFSNKDAKDMFPEKIFVIENDIEKAFEHAMKKTKKDDILLVTGSLFVVAEVRRILRKKVEIRK